MPTRLPVSALLASLVAASCVLPESGGGIIGVGGAHVSISVGGDTQSGGATSFTGSGTVGNTGGSGGIDTTGKSQYLNLSGGCSGDAGIGGSDAGCNCGTGGAPLCSPGYVWHGGSCVKPQTRGCDAKIASQDSGTPYDPYEPEYLLNLPANRVMGFIEYFSAGDIVVALGAVTDLDPADPQEGTFRMALYRNNGANGTPTDLVIVTSHDLSTNTPEESLSSPYCIDTDGEYWIMIWAGESTVHVEMTNQMSARIVFYDPNSESEWPQGASWANPLWILTQPKNSSYTGVLPHLYAKYLPSTGANGCN